MKEDPKELTQKKYVQLRKRLYELETRKSSLPYRTLKEPIQDGWSVLIELSEEALRRKDGLNMAKALALATKSKCVTRSSSIVSKIRKDPKYLNVRPLFMWESKWYDGTIHRGYNGPEIKPITEKQFNKIDNPAESKWWSRRESSRVLKWSGQTVIDIDYVLNIREHYFDVKVKKRMITKVQDINPALEKEIAEVEEQLKPYWRTYPGSRYGQSMRETPRNGRKLVKSALNKVKKGELDDIFSDHKLSKKHML